VGFSPLDYAFLAAYLIGSTALGLYFSRMQRDVRDYFLGGRNLPWYAVCFSIVATETSTLTFIGVPALAYGSNMTFLQLTFGYFLARVLISLFFLPAYYRGNLVTAYNFLSQRFGQGARNVAALIFMVTRVLADGVRLFATAIPLKIATGFSYPVSIAIIGVVTIFYTYLGGIRAVVWMDMLQFCLYVSGALIAVGVILTKLPQGLSEVLAVAGPLGKLQIFNGTFSLHIPYTIWAGFVGGTFLTMASHGTDQLMVQRLLTCRRPSDSQKALIGSGFLIIAQFLFFLFIGVMLYVFYQRFPMETAIERSDEIFPLFIVNQLPRGLSGVVVAAIFAAAMSTLSSSLNSLASSTILDIYKPFLSRSRELSPQKELLISRMVTLFWGGLLMGVAAMASNWGNVLEAGLKIASFTYGGILGTFLLGLSFRRTSQSEAITAMLVGLFAMLAVSQTPVAWPWYVFIGTTATFSTGAILTFLRRG